MDCGYNNASTIAAVSTVATRDISLYPQMRVWMNEQDGADFADADIWLWPSTANNTVECAWWGHVVVDLGVDNELIGCGDSGAPGATTQAARGDSSGLEKALAGRGGYGR